MNSEFLLLQLRQSKERSVFAPLRDRSLSDIWKHIQRIEYQRLFPLVSEIDAFAEERFRRGVVEGAVHAFDRPFTIEAREEELFL